MKHRRQRQKAHKIFAEILLSILVIGILLAGTVIALDCAKGEEAETWTLYTICMEKDYIHIRRKASTKSESIGYLLCGDEVVTDGTMIDGFWHIIGLTEYGEGWVNAGYLSDSPPLPMNGAKYQINANGRVACRKSIDGKRRCWAKNQETVKVWYWTNTWCLTNKGFIKTEFLSEEEAGS